MSLYICIRKVGKGWSSLVSSTSVLPFPLWYYPILSYDITSHLFRRYSGLDKVRVERIAKNAHSRKGLKGQGH